MLAIGLYNILDLQQYGFFTQNTYTPPSAIFVAVGALKMVFSIVGIIALFVRKKPIFAIYIGVLIFLMLVTFLAAIYGFLQRPGAWTITNERLDEAFSSYGTFRNDIATVQTTLNCCGYNASRGADSYTDYGLAVLQNCTNVTRDPVTTIMNQGCVYYLTEEIQYHLYLIGAIGMAFGTVELASFLIAMQNMEGL